MNNAQTTGIFRGVAGWLFGISVDSLELLFSGSGVLTFWCNEESICQNHLLCTLVETASGPKVESTSASVNTAFSGNKLKGVAGGVDIGYEYMNAPPPSTCACK